MGMQAKMPTLAIFDINYPAARWFAWAARRAGCPVRAYSVPGRFIARFSRYLPPLDRCPDPADLADFGEWAQARMQAGEFDLIAPTSDLMCHHAAMSREWVPEPWRSRLPATEDVEACLFKDRFSLHCQAAEVPHPRTVFAETVEELLARVPDEVGFPAVIKPRSHVHLPSDRGGVVDNLDQVRKRLLDYEAMARQAKGRQRDYLPLVQQYLPTINEACNSVSGVLAADGQALALSGSRKLAQAPPRTGVGIWFERVDDPDLLALGGEYAKRLIGRGMFELELVPDPDDGRLLAIDLNPRAFGQMDLDISAGKVLPLMWLDTVLGTQSRCEIQPRQARHAINPVYFRLAGASMPSVREQRSAVLAGKPVHIGSVPGDWSGNLAYALRSFRHARTMLRAPSSD